MRNYYLLALFAPVAAYVALRAWRRKHHSGSEDDNAGFRPRLGFSHLDGMESISLILANKSGTPIWAEEIEIFLSGLVAKDQTAEPSRHRIHKIRQMVPPDEVLPVSLAEPIYKAAGEPQRRYSGVLSSVVRYRIGAEWFERPLENYRVWMIGLTTAEMKCEHKPVQPFQAEETPQRGKEMETTLK